MGYNFCNCHFSRFQVCGFEWTSITRNNPDLVDSCLHLRKFPISEESPQILERASQGVLVVKNPPASAGDLRDTGSRHRFNPWVRKILWRKKWQLTLVSLPGKFHGQRSLVGYSPWGHQESDTTDYLSLSWHRKFMLGKENSCGHLPGGVFYTQHTC